MKGIDLTNLLPKPAEEYASMTPTAKLEAIKAMGFKALWEEHQPDCPNQFDSGMRCNCVPPGTVWSAPRDVREHMHETWDELKERKGGKR